MILSPEHEHRLRRVVYLSGFFLHASVAINAYITSSFFEKFVGEQNVGIVYVLISLLMLALALNAQQIVEAAGIRRTIIGTLLASLATGIVMMTWAGAWAGVLAAILHSAVTYLLIIALDLYLEHLSEDEITGSIRGIYLTLANLAYLVSPLLSSLALDRYGFGAVFAISCLSLLPLTYLVFDHLIELPRRQYEKVSIWHTAWRLWQAPTEHARDVRSVITLSFILNFFYAIMVIYEPIYLHQYLGMSWPEIGIVFTIMLIPFVTLDFILGKIADRWLGEKELMIFGILLMGGLALVMPSIATPSVLIWAIVLFVSRVGAASLEMMSESYLFKKVDSKDINSIFLSRSMYPLAYVVAPLVTSLFLLFAPFPAIFYLLGGVVLAIGLPAVFQLKDTR